jgi:hypothetical protein
MKAIRGTYSAIGTVGVSGGRRPRGFGRAVGLLAAFAVPVLSCAQTPFAAAAPPDAPRGAGVAVLSSGPGSATLEITPRHLAPSQVNAGGMAYARFDVDGSVAADGRMPGSPDLPVLTFTLLLRSLANRVEVVSAEFSDTSNVLPSPVPGLIDAEDGPVRSYGPDPAAYASAGFAPSDIAWLADVGMARGKAFGSLIVAPLRYDPSTRVLRRYTKIVVRVSAAGPAAGATVPDPFTDGIAVNGPSRQGGGGQARPAPMGRTATLEQSVLAQGTWFRIPVTEEGLYRLTGQRLSDAGVPASADPSTIRVFGNGGDELPMNPLAVVPDDLVEVARLVADNGTTGALDPSDEVIFYAKGTRGWKYDPASKRMSHTINRYWETAYYWITFGGVAGKPMAAPGPGPAPDFAAASVEGGIFREDERQNILSSGLSWLGQSFDAGDRITYVVPLPGLVPGSTVRYRLKLGSRASAPSTFTISDHGAQLGAPAGIPATVVGSYYHDQVLFATAERTATASWTDGQSLLTLAYSSLSSAGTGYLDWYELFYDRQTVAQGDRFGFSMPDTSAVVAYAVTGFSGTGVRAFDVSRHDSVVLLATDHRSDTCLFSVAGAPGARRRILLAGPSGYLSPAALAPVPNQDLRGDPGVADLIIIAPPPLLQAANRLKEYRERPGPDRLAVRVVNLDELYNEFGGGIPSPIAIRDYLKYAIGTQSPAPRYALLFGDGDFDYRRITATGPMMVPPWETESSYRPLDTYASDDYFSMVDGSGRVQLGLGRLTAQNAAEAETMVDKIIEYETAPVMDTWKTLVTFVGDDGLAAAGEDDRFLHVIHAENVSRLLPGLFDQSKVYLFDYPTEISASGRRKPDVNRAIREAIDRGTLVLNYSGHGNPRLWAHEAVFVRENDIPLLANKGKYFILVAATCNYANFDAINDQSGAELLAAKRDAGAIATLSATRVVTAFENYRLNATFFAYLFNEDSLGRMTVGRIGDAMFGTKQTHTSVNDEKYFLLGDPALIPAFPVRMVAVDSVNNVPADSVVDIYALGRSSMAASIYPDSGAAPYSGSARVTVYDADRLVTISDPTAGTYQYRAAGDILFRGEATVSADRLGANFVVPKDISYGAENGRISVYTWSGTADGAGYTRNIRIAGTDTTAPPDAEGPAIAIYLDSRGFRPGDAVSAAPTLILDLADSSGVNTSRAGVGHRLEAWFDGQPSSVDLTDYYRSAPDTYTKGAVTYPVGALAEGSHHVRVRAWDTYNNSATAETQFSVGEGGGLSLSNVYNYPNPFSGSTWFTFEHDQMSPVDVEVKIYTVAGRMIHSLPAYAVEGRLVKVAWDGRDREGDAVANGVYLYKVIARTLDGKYSGEALGKLSVTR